MSPCRRATSATVTLRDTPHVFHSALRCKSKVSFDILEMFHQGTQKELEFVEFYGFFGVPHL